jgi:hypothetical protein
MMHNKTTPEPAALAISKEAAKRLLKIRVLSKNNSNPFGDSMVRQKNRKRASFYSKNVRSLLFSSIYE